MNRLALLLGSLAVVTVSLATATKAAVADDQKRLAALDTRYQRAVKENDAKTMDAILAEDFVVVIGHRYPRRPTRASSEYLAALCSLPVKLAWAQVRPTCVHPGRSWRGRRSNS
jgi:hypothetical protein